MTLSEWFKWLAENDWPESLAERTIADRLSRFTKYAAPIWGAMPLRKIDPLKVRSFYRKLKEDGVGQPTILALKRDLVRAFNQAVSPYQQVPMTWANPFRLTLQAAPPRDAVALTPQAAKKALLSPKLTEDRRAMLAVFLLSGVRLSEQMAMTRGQLLFEQGLIYIDRSIKFGSKGNQSVGLPKGNKVRLAVMCPTLVRVLRAHTEGMSSEQVIWAAFSENKARMKKLVYATWRTIVKDAGLPAEMTPHDCRLSHINWIEKLMPEVSATTLKEHVGHAAQGVTEANYTRPLTPAQELLAKHIERVVGVPIQADGIADAHVACATG
jgi:integrase